MSHDLLIRGGDVVSSSGVERADVTMTANTRGRSDRTTSRTVAAPPPSPSPPPPSPSPTRISWA